MVKILYAGPWVGEFGWEIMGWQGKLRAMSVRFDEVVIGCHPASRPLYQDFATRFEDAEFGFSRSMQTCKDKPNRMLAQKFKAAGSYPGNQWVRSFCYRPKHQHYIRYGDSRCGVSYRYLLHARHRSVGAGHNWPIEKWEELLAWMNGKVACIGSSKEALHVKGTDDLRDIPLQELMNTMAASDMVIGPSSGPIHLAALCGCKSVVWTNLSHSCRGMSNASRLLKKWNPFRTPVSLVGDGWNPSVEDVREAL